MKPILIQKKKQIVTWIHIPWLLDGAGVTDVFSSLCCDSSRGPYTALKCVYWLMACVKNTISFFYVGHKNDHKKEMWSNLNKTVKHRVSRNQQFQHRWIQTKDGSMVMNAGSGLY